MSDVWPTEWQLSISRDAAVVLEDWLDKAQRTGEWTLDDGSVRAAFNALLCALETANDGTCFSPRYAEELAASRQRLAREPS